MIKKSVNVKKKITISKTAEYKKAQEILYKIENKIKLKAGDEDFNFLVNEVFINHSSWEEKKGVGIKFIISKKPTHTIYNRYPCFHIIRTDGTTIDISYTHCFGNKTPKKQIEDDVKNACRTSIEKEIEKERLKIKFPFNCPILNIMKLSCKGIEIHHQEITFDDIFHRWLIGKDINEMYKNIHKENYGSEFLDKNIENDFIDFHNKLAKLLPISIEGHKHIHKLNMEREKIKDLLKMYKN